jgi:RNA polymerase sigma-70 factor (ECF subfamily)
LKENEQACLVQAQKGDEEAFTHLVETYQKPVYNLCYRMLGDPQEAEDAAQETFWRAYQGFGRYDMQRSFITWLLSIAAHYCIDQQRRRRLPIIGLELLPEESVPDPTPGPERKFVRSEEDRLVRKLLGDLGPQDRAALVLHYWYDFSDQEIANALSLSVSAVKSRLHRSRKVLAQRWKTIQPPFSMKEEAA